MCWHVGPARCGRTLPLTACFVGCCLRPAVQELASASPAPPLPLPPSFQLLSPLLLPLPPSFQLLSPLLLPLPLLPVLQRAAAAGQSAL